MSTTTTTPTIQSRKDIDDILTAIEYHAEQMVEEARGDCSLSISQVFEAHERADELITGVRALESLVMLPIDLYEAVWGVIEEQAREAKAGSVLEDHLLRLLKQLREYNIR
jgi:hypothetical protein